MSKEPKHFDNIQYDVGDVVIMKFKGDNPTKKTIKTVEMVGNLDDMVYQVLQFKETGNTWDTSFNYEPFDLEERKEYHRIWAETDKLRGNSKSGRAVGSIKVKDKVIRVKLKKNK